MRDGACGRAPRQRGGPPWYPVPSIHFPHPTSYFATSYFATSYFATSYFFQVIAALSRGNAHRVVAAMKMNARSSRSHAIFSLSLTEMSAGGERSGEAGKLSLVDLAGMEVMLPLPINGS